MPKSALARRLDQFVSDMSGVLAANGFRGSKRVFRREPEAGFKQLIDLGMARANSSYYGKFTVDVGVFIHEVHAAMNDWKPSRMTTLVDCEVRARLPTLDSGEDRWWDLRDPPSTFKGEVRRLLEEVAVPFLDQIDSREKLVREWERRGSDKIGLPPRGRLSIAVIEAARGNRKRAAQLLDEEEENAAHIGYREFVQRARARVLL